MSIELANKKRGPIFIVGCGRTGSKLLIQILNSHPWIGMGSEMHIANPWYKLFGIDNYDKIKKFGDLKKDENAVAVIDFCFSNEIIGDFWYHSRRELNKKTLLNRFLKSDRSMKSIFKIFIEEKAEYENASIPGSRFPLHTKYLPMLMKWYPNSKIIHITRDPRAILSSEIHKKKKPRYPISKKYKLIYDTLLTFYVIVQYKSIIKVHKKYSKLDRYLLCKFENLVKSPETVTKDLCQFLNIDFQEGMLDVKVSESSYDDTGGRGFNKKAVDKWKEKLDVKQRNLIELFLSKEIEMMGYDTVHKFRKKGGNY